MHLCTVHTVYAVVPFLRMLQSENNLNTHVSYYKETIKQQQ